MNRLIALRNNTLARYIVVGGLSYVIEVGALWVLIYGLQLSPLLAVGISFWIGFVVAFLLQKLFAFKDTSKGVKRIATQSVAYGVLVLINFGFTLGFVGLIGPLIGVVVARTIALIITTGWNYLVYSRLIFRTP